jgi:hypothetical protein
MLVVFPDAMILSPGACSKFPLVSRPSEPPTFSHAAANEATS